MLRATLSCLCLVGCSATAPAPAPAPKCPPTLASPPAPATPKPAEAEPVKAFRPPPTPDPTWSLSTDDVALQLEDEATSTIDTETTLLEPFGRTPAFTLYRDGTVIFEEDRRDRDRAGIFVYRLPEFWVTDTLDHVRRLGFAQMRSYTNTCLMVPGGPMCMSDGSYPVLRVKLPGRPRREIRNHGGWEPRHQARLTAIYDRIRLLRFDGQRAVDVRPYLPPKATLFLSTLHALSALDTQTLASAHPWPLPAALVDQAGAEGPLFMAIDAAQVRALIVAAGTNAVRREWFLEGDRMVQATVVPWLPGVDHTAAIEQARRQKK